MTHCPFSSERHRVGRARTKRKFVDVSVWWGNDECNPTAKVPLDEWEEIVDGAEVSAFAPYWYDGEKFTALFFFNCDGNYGRLEVTYDDGGQGFTGHIRDAVITGGEFPPEHAGATSRGPDRRADRR